MTKTISASRRMTWILAAAGLAWICFIGLRARDGWPSMPLDMSAADAETRAVLDKAVTRHLTHAVLLGLGVPVLLYGISQALRRLSGGSKGEIAYTGDAAPARILLLRHAEKTSDPDDIHLSEAGEARARELARYIPAEFGAPDFIFAAARSKRSNRSIETVTPLAQALAKPVISNVEDRDFQQLAELIFADPIYRGKNIVICWHHGKLPEIAAALGAAPGTYPEPWPEDLYKLIVDLRYGGGQAPEVRQVTQPF